MGLAETLSDGLGPHVSALGQTINHHGERIQSRLDDIHRKIGDLGRPDTGDIWYRMAVRGNYTGGTLYELATVGIGEIFLVQSITTNGPPNTSPAYTIRSNGYLIAAVIKEGIGTENPGGDIVCLQGEKIIFEPGATGVFDFVLTVLRREFARKELSADLGPIAESLGTRNTHEPGRDYVKQPPPLEWEQSPMDTENTVGRPALVSGGVDPVGV